MPTITLTTAEGDRRVFEDAGVTMDNDARTLTVHDREMTTLTDDIPFSEIIEVKIDCLEDE